MTKTWCHRQAITFLKTLERSELARYTDYWSGIAPKNFYEYYQRWVFAYTSIHFTWQANVRAFHAIMGLPLDAPLERIVQVLQDARTGCHRQRGFVIWEFRNRFWANPYDWYPRKNEELPEFRTRLAKTARGIGLAKTSFLLELTFPKDCGVVCLDTHMLQLYNYDQKARGAPTYKEYREIEDHWVGTCRRLKISSPMARHIFFDKKQNAQDTRYWSYVLEDYERRPDGSSIVTTPAPKLIDLFKAA